MVYCIVYSCISVNSECSNLAHQTAPNDKGNIIQFRVFPCRYYVLYTYCIQFIYFYSSLRRFTPKASFGSDPQHSKEVLKRLICALNRPLHPLAYRVSLDIILIYIKYKCTTIVISIMYSILWYIIPCDHSPPP